VTGFSGDKYAVAPHCDSAQDIEPGRVVSTYHDGLPKARIARGDGIYLSAVCVYLLGAIHR